MTFFNFFVCLFSTVPWFTYTCFVLFTIFFCCTHSSSNFILSFLMKVFMTLQSFLNTIVIISLQFLRLLFPSLFSEHCKTEVGVCVCTCKLMRRWGLILNVRYFYVICLLVIKFSFYSSVLIACSLSNHLFCGTHGGFLCGCLSDNFWWVSYRPLKRICAYWSVRSLILVIRNML